jgi:hypothetical protein
MRFSRALLAGCLTVVPTPTLAQHPWNDEATQAIVARAVQQRARVRADSLLQSYRAVAHGYVLFLGQLGEGLDDPPRLIKSDELVLEVYWKAPGLSKQRIIGWRDRVDLPTDIQYHRDHLGIVQNNFGDRIGLGHNDEVRGVPHPLAPDGPSRYDFALVDSLEIRLPNRLVRVYEVLTRPRDPAEPGVAGSLYLDAATAELVRFRFNFTRNAYVDESIEDITIVLENGLWDGRWWLPRRQEIEIRRRTVWLDIPARGIIRGQWEIADYEFNVALPDTMFLGFEIVAAPRAERDTFAWGRPLDAAIRDAIGPASTVTFDEVRERVRDLVAERALSGLPRARPGVRSLSDLLHVNRVEGLAPGAGGVLRPAGGRWEIRGWAGYGFADRRVKARLAVQRALATTTIGVEAAREIADIGDEPVIAPVLNSLVAQEAGDDFGDYVLRHQVRATLRQRLGYRSALTVGLGVERTATIGVRAAPAHGTFRPNPALGAGTFAVGFATLEGRVLPIGAAHLGARVTVEGGKGEGVSYARLRGEAALELPAGVTAIAVRGWGGWGSRELPGYRSFVLGGRTTLMSEPFRAWGGRRAAFGRLEWRIPVPAPAIPLGAFASTGDRAILAPFVSAGWAAGAIGGVPWQPTGEVLGVAGVAVEVFHGLIRVEAGASLRERRAGLVIDLRRDLWSIL